MARGRDSKGRFLKSGSSKRKRRRSRRRRGRGMGNIITVRRAGMGAIDMPSLLPVLIGGGLTALTALGIRWFVQPSAGQTQSTMVKWAPLVGHAVGSVASIGLYFMGGTTAAVQSFLAASAVGLYGVGSDMIFKEKAGSLLAAIAATAPAVPDAALQGYGMGAIVPEYSSAGMGAIAMEQMGPGGRRAGSIGSYGETVSLNGVNTGAFGTPGFQA